jgi:hypothetical protein
MLADSALCKLIEDYKPQENEWSDHIDHIVCDFILMQDEICSLFVNEKCARLDLYEAIYNTLVLYDPQKNDVYRLKIMEALSAYYADKKVTCLHTNDQYKLLEMLELLYNKMQSYIKMEHDQDHKERGIIELP